jgi:hypothetical protein
MNRGQMMKVPFAGSSTLPDSRQISASAKKGMCSGSVGNGEGGFIVWLDITASKFYDWRERYGKVNEHNGWVPPRFLARGLGEAGHPLAFI